MILTRVLLVLTTGLAVHGAVIGHPDIVGRPYSKFTNPALDPRDVYPHHEITGLPETLPNNNTGLLYKAYQPYLEIVNGCVPYPAVDEDGNTSAGLSHHGTESGGCKNSVGQAYVRGTLLSTGQYVLMYAWYMPKDVPSRGMGHRHEWEGTLVFLNSANSTSASNIISVCPSAHGKWNCGSDFLIDGTGGGHGPLLSYAAKWPLNHSMWLGRVRERGERHPLVGWEALPEEARRALQETDFRAGTVPFKDGTFERNVASARFR